MSAMASQITGVGIIYSTVCSGADQRKHQSSASLAFVREIHRWAVNSAHKGPITRNIFPFDDVIIIMVATAGQLQVKYITWYHNCHIIIPLFLIHIITHWGRDKISAISQTKFSNAFFNENVWLSFKISLKCVPKAQISNISAYVQILTWRWSGDKPLLVWWLVYRRIYASLGLNELSNSGTIPLAHLMLLLLIWDRSCLSYILSQLQ